ncbi:MAG TPA: response regulator [Planctomycetota bacterium]|nr:response regulator [Planctomycetota bacterium]
MVSHPDSAGEVLIADNDRAVSALLTEVLLRAGLSARHAFDGDVAQRLARDPAVKVLVCDLDMPRLGGIEVLESLADLPAPPLTVVISGYLDAKVRERIDRLPFVRDVLRKPFDLLAFASRVHDLASAAGPDDAASAAPRPG